MLDRALIDAIARSYPTTYAEAIRRNEQQFVFLCLVRERLRIRFERLDPQVERTIGLDVFITELIERMSENLAVHRISFHIRRLIYAALDNALEEDRRANVAKGTTGTTYCQIDFAGIMDLVRNCLLYTSPSPRDRG